MNVPSHIAALHGLDYLRHRLVSGGDINDAYLIETSNGKLFLKLNTASKYPQMFQREAEGLEALRQTASFKAPAVVGVGEYAQQQYLLMEWLDTAQVQAGFWQQFAAALAKLHQQTSSYFGWSSSNYIGSLYQSNQHAADWATFYSSQRILPLTKQLRDSREFAATDVANTELLCSKLSDLFPAEPPALLHGDLWAGNYMVALDADTAVPAIFDPAVYYGHREMDIGMSLLFGGFDSSMYDFYNELYPMESQWRQRVSLTQLYPLLVHAVLFGGGYVAKCRNILHKWS